MRVYLQWTRANPQDWEALDITTARDWRNAIKNASRSEPDGSEVITDAPEFIYDLEVQGVQMSGADHIHIDADGGALVLTRWNDDPVDWAGDRSAQRWTFRLPVMDGRVGKLQPRQSLSVWAEAQARKDIYAQQNIGAGEWNEPVVVNDWSAFTPPGPANMVVHGIWVSDQSVLDHQVARTPRGFRRFVTENT